MKHLQTKHKSPRSGFVALLSASLAVLVLFGLFLQFGWRSCKSTLNTVSGDDGKLNDFTVLMSRSLDVSCQNYELIRLENGTLHSEFVFDGEKEWSALQSKPYLSGGFSGTVPASEHEKVDAKAVSDAYPDDVTHWYSDSNTVLLMADFYADPGRIRFPLGEFSFEEPLTLYAFQTNTGKIYDYSVDYKNEEWYQFISENHLLDLYSNTPVSLGEAVGYCQRFAFGGLKAGVYRITEMPTNQEVEEMRKDGTVQGNDVLLNSTSIGQTELFYSTPDCVIALECYAMEEHSVLLLYLNTDRKLCADLVDRNGTCTDRWCDIPVNVDEYQQEDSFQVNVTEMVRPDLSCLALRFRNETGMSGRNDKEKSQLVLFRVENGRFVTKEVRERTPEQTPLLAQLNQAGDALLEISEIYTEFGTVETASSREVNSLDSYVTGYSVTVRNISDDQLVYEGVLDIGSERNWRYDWYQISNRAYYSSYDRNTLDVFPTVFEGGAAS